MVELQVAVGGHRRLPVVACRQLLRDTNADDDFVSRVEREALDGAELHLAGIRDDGDATNADVLTHLERGHRGAVGRLQSSSDLGRSSHDSAFVGRNEAGGPAVGADLLAILLDGDRHVESVDSQKEDDEGDDEGDPDGEECSEQYGSQRVDDDDADELEDGFHLKVLDQASWKATASRSKASL